MAQPEEPTQPAQSSAPETSAQSGEASPGLVDTPIPDIQAVAAAADTPMKGTHPCTDHGLASPAALTLASVPAVALAVPQDEASQNEASPITLDLYNLTDVHGHIQQVAKKGVVREAGLPAMNCYLKKARATYTVGSVTFLLAGGDSFEALTRGEHPRRTEIWTAILSTPTWARTRVRRPAPSPSADASDGSQSGSQAAAPTQHKNAKAPKNSLARTGADAEGLVGALFVAAIGGAGLVARRRANRYQSENK